MIFPAREGGRPRLPIQAAEGPQRTAQAPAHLGPARPEAGAHGQFPGRIRSSRCAPPSLLPGTIRLEPVVSPPDRFGPAPVWLGPIREKLSNRNRGVFRPRAREFLVFARPASRTRIGAGSPAFHRVHSR